MQDHKEKPRGFRCLRCNKNFKGAKILRVHIKNIHTNPKPKYKCCGISYVSQKKYMTHRDKYHNDQFERLSNSEFLCKYCSKTFQSYQTVVDHINNKHTKDSKFLCNICSATYHSMAVLRRHIRRHTEQEEFNIKVVFECSYCNREFSTSDSLDAHKLTAHTEHYDKLVDGKYKCKHCDKTVVAKITMQEHLNANHLHDQSFLCGMCGKNCYSRISLRKHENTHEKDNTFSCDICTRFFKHEELLKRHQRAIHGRRKRIPCSISGCKKSFSSQKSFMQHVEINHPDIDIDTQVDEDDPDPTTIETLMVIEEEGEPMTADSQLVGSENDPNVFYEIEELSNEGNEKENGDDAETITIYEF